MAPLSHKKYCGTSKLCFTHKDQSVRSNFELSYNERTLIKPKFSKAKRSDAVAYLPTIVEFYRRIIYFIGNVSFL